MSELPSALAETANPIIVGTGVPDCPQNSKVTQIFAKQGYRKFVREDALPDKLPTRKGRAYNASQNIVGDGVPDVPRKLE